MKNNSDKVEKATDNKCPHISDPLMGCYGTRFDSANTQRAVEYCLRDFVNCEIYMKNREAQKVEQK